MKGFANTVMFVLMLVVVITMLVAYVTISTRGGTTRVRGLSLETQTMDTGIELAKEFVRTSAAYSLHQACYTHLKELDLDQDAMLGKIKSSMEAHMADYSSQSYKFLDHNIRVPYYTITLEPTQSGVKVTGESDNEFSASSTKSNVSISIRDEAGFSDTVDTECWSLYLSASDLNTKLKTAMEEGSASLIAGLPSGIHSGTSSFLEAPAMTSDPTEKCMMVFEKASGITYAQANESLKTLMGGIVSTELHNLISSHALSANLIPDFSVVSENRFTESVEIVCTLNYIAEAEVSVTLEGSKTYPVWNGTDITMDKLTAEMGVQARYNPAEAF